MCHRLGVHRLLRGFFVALGVVAVLVVLVLVGWLVDVRNHEDRVLRNVELVDATPVGGLRRPAVTAEVERLAAQYAAAGVQIEAEGTTIATSTAELASAVDVPASVEAVFDIGRGGSAWSRFQGWAVALVGTRTSDLEVTVDRRTVQSVVTAKDTSRKPPVEPKVVFQDGSFQVVNGAGGEGVDHASVAEAIPEAAQRVAPLRIRAERGPVPPRFTDDEARALASEAARLVATPLPIRAGDASAEVPVDSQRSWVTSVVTDAGLRLAVDAATAQPEIEKLLERAGEAAVETRFTVEGGGVRITPGRPGTQCCDAAAVARVQEAVLVDAPVPPVQLPLRPRAPSISAEEAVQLQIAEPIGSFTTAHPGNQGRVRNIHRIADLIRGQVIKPGETFSVNDFVGRRTAAKGFVSAGVIENGVFTEDIGGGISQFATTTFNAAFFAGLDIPEYQSHSIYITRYPYGREATLSFPKPDLKLKNNTPYGVLLWPTYTETSITMTMYSTRWVTGAQTNQTRGRSGNCTRVTTERTRTYTDGRTEKDEVFATYRPAEGVNC